MLSLFTILVCLSLSLSLHVSHSLSIYLSHSSPVTTADFSGEDLAKKLITSHDVTRCGWINDENQTLFSHNFSPESFLSFPSQTLDSRLSQLQMRFLCWYQLLLSFPLQIQIPEEVSQSQWTKFSALASGADIDSNSGSSSSLLLSLETLIKAKDKTAVISASALLGALYCSLYCWDPSSSHSPLSASCSLCGRTFTCQTSASALGVGNPLSVINPSQEHKYYCPVVSSYRPLTVQQQDSSVCSSGEAVPAGYLQMIEALLMNSVGWKVCLLTLSLSLSHTLSHPF
jgi:hypothetical protein